MSIHIKDYGGTAPDEGGMTRDEAQALYEFISFAMGFVVVRRKADDVTGTLDFQHGPPRVYFGFQADS